jgi:putative aldouronate transport system substrate-binding protein
MAKRILGAALAALTVCSTAAGCQKKQADATAANSGPKVTMTVEIFDRGKSGQPDLNNNYWTKYVNDNFGKKYNVNVQWVSVPRTQEVDKLNVLMASNQAPDLSFTYNATTIYKYVSQGGLTQLDSTLSSYGKNLTKYLGKSLLKYGEFNGKQFAIPGKRTMLMNNNIFVRKDWLDKLGMKVPTTRDEFYTMLVAFRDKNPGNVKGGCIPCGLAINGHLGTANLEYSFYKDISEPSLAKSEYTSGWSMDGFKEYMQYLNKLYNENLVSKDFAIDKNGTQLNADVTNGKAGVFFSSWDMIYRSSPGIYTSLKKNVSGAELVPVDCFKNLSYNKYTKNVYIPLASFMIIPKSSKNAKQVVEYLNWMSDKKVTLDIQFGEEGIDYTLKDGIPVPKVPTTYVGQKFQGNVCNGDFDMLHNGPEVGSSEKNINAIAYSYPGYETEARAAAKIALTDGFTFYTSTIPSTSASKYQNALAEKSNQMKAILVSCKPSEFSAKYDQLYKDYLTAGAQAIIDENIKNYKTETGKTIK